MVLFRELRRRSFARFYDTVAKGHEELIRERRKELCARASGTVLEIGPGTGANLEYLPEDVSWIGLEPNEHMHPSLLERAREHGRQAEIRGIGAEAMDVADASVDVVLATLVLCSVDDPGRVIADVRRVLVPGGRLLFLEHVAAPAGTVLRGAQAVARPFWSFLCDGCCPDRETGALLRAAGFQALELEEFRLPVREALVTAPHIVGEARN